MDEGVIMNDKEKEKRCCAAGRDASGQLVDRCKVYSRYVVHEAPDRRYGCADCSFAIRARQNDKPRWV